MFNKAIRGFLDTANGWAKTGVDGCFKVVFVPAKGVAGMALGEDHFVTRTIGGVQTNTKAATDLVVDGTTVTLGVVVPIAAGVLVDHAIESTLGLGGVAEAKPK